MLKKEKAGARGAIYDYLRAEGFDITRKRHDHLKQLLLEYVAIEVADVPYMKEEIKKALDAAYKYKMRARYLYDKLYGKQSLKKNSH